MNLVPVQIRMLPEYWQEAWELLEPAAARNGLYTKESVLSALCSGDFQLWIAEDDVMRMAAITEIAVYPGRKIGCIELMGGENYEEAIEFLTDIEEWARENGVNRFVNEGRPGLSKALLKRGYRVESIRMVKDFHDA